MFLESEDPLAKDVVDAIHKGHVDKLKALLQSQAGLATASIRHGTEARPLLHIATDWPGNFPNGAEAVKVLIEAGADVDAPFLGNHAETALHWAASCDDVPVLDALLDAGANINAGGGVIAETPLADARAFLQLKAAHRLVERGADVTLQDAATLGSLDRVRGFFDGSAQESPSKEDVDFALWNACHGGQLDVVKYLHGRGASVNVVPPWEDLTPLDAARRRETKNKELEDWLEEQGGKELKDIKRHLRQRSPRGDGTSDRKGDVAKIDDFQATACSAIEVGAAGVEPVGSNGYLINQFINDSVNNRADQWGCSVKNKARFVLETVKALVDEVRAERVALRLSPCSEFLDCYASDPGEQYLYIIRELKKAGYKLAYLSLVEFRGNSERLWTDAVDMDMNNEDRTKLLDRFLREWDNQSPVIVAGAYLPDRAVASVEEWYKDWHVVIGFGRFFTSNPDLVFLVQHGIDFAPYDWATLYAKKSPQGHNDFPFCEEYLKAVEDAKR